LGNRRKRGDCVFVRAFRMNRLATREAELLAEQPHRLLGPTDEMHLDTASRTIVDRLVLKARNVEGRSKSPVDPRQHVEIESSGYAGGIVIGSQQGADVLDEIDADDEPAIR